MTTRMRTPMLMEAGKPVTVKPRSRRVDDEAARHTERLLVWTSGIAFSVAVWVGLAVLVLR